MTSERTADADVATVRAAVMSLLDHEDAYDGFTKDYVASSIEALDRLAALVAQHRDTQEALRYATEALERLSNADGIGMPTLRHPYMLARAALASVRARTPQ